MAAIRLLVADDHVVVREGLRWMLSTDTDVEIVGEADSAASALEAVAELMPDVVLLDVHLPDRSGLEVLTEMRERFPDVPVVVLSMADEPAYVEEAVRAGAAGYLLKTASGDELVNAIRSVFSGEPVLHPSVLRKVMGYFHHASRPARQEQPSTPLTEREKEVLLLAARGMSNKGIASQLFLSSRTVEGYLRSIFNKVGVGSRTEAVIVGLRRGVLHLEDLDEG